MNNSDLTKLGINIKSLRLESGWTQEKLAEKTGLHRTYISGVERGDRNISFINILKLSRALDVAISRLFDDIK